MKIKRLLFIACGSVLAMVGIGYVVALEGLTRCKDDMWSEVLTKNVTGLDMHGQVVPASSIQVYSRIEYPFVVVAGYAVPFDLHASYHESRFLVLPGYTHKLSSASYSSI